MVVGSFSRHNVLLSRQKFAFALPCEGKVHVHAIKAHGGVEVQLHSYLTFVVVGGKLSDSLPGRFTTVTGPRYTLTKGLGGPQRHSECFGEEKIFCLC